MITISESLNIQFQKFSHIQSDFFCFQFKQEVEKSKYEKNRNERRPLSNG